MYALLIVTLSLTILLWLYAMAAMIARFHSSTPTSMPGWVWRGLPLAAFLANSLVVYLALDRGDLDEALLGFAGIVLATVALGAFKVGRTGRYF